MRYLPLWSALLLLFLVVSGCNRNGDVHQPVESDAVLAAFEYLGRGHSIASPREQLRLVEEKRDDLGQVHLRFQQVHADIPVYGSQIIVHLKPDLSGRHLTGRLVEIPAEVSVEPKISPERAQALAMGEPCAEETQTPELVYRVTGGDPRLAFRVPGRKGLLKCDVFVAADEPVVLGIVNRSPSSPVGE